MKTRIAIIGLLPVQARRLALKFPRTDLVFASGKGNVVRLPRADHAVLVIKFINHRWSEVARLTYPVQRLHYHTGGMSGLASLVGDIGQGQGRGQGDGGPVVSGLAPQSVT
jgi:hypothetical protein